MNRRKSRDQREEYATDSEQDRIGDPDFAGNDRQQGDDNETNQN